MATRRSTRRHKPPPRAAGAKGMMPIGADLTRPFLDYVLSALADAGCTSVCFVVAPDHTAIRDYYDGAGRPTRLAIDYAVQPIADGTARAVQSAQRLCRPRSVPGAQFRQPVSCGGAARAGRSRRSGPAGLCASIRWCTTAAFRPIA